MYVISEYDKRYMPRDKSRHPLVHANYVKMPANPRGDGIQTLLKYKRGLEVFAIWCLLLEKTTLQNPENRGKLLNHKDEPATPAEIALGISLEGRVKLVEYALSVLVAMNWVICVPNAGSCGENASPSVVEWSVVECSGMQCKYTDAFESFWKKFKGRWNPEKDNYVKVRKWEAFVEWQKLCIEDQRKAWATADKVSGKYVPDACRWLKNRLFDNFKESNEE